MGCNICYSVPAFNRPLIFGKSFRQETYSYSVAKFCQYMKRWKYFNFNLPFPPNPLHSGWHFRRSGLKLCLWVELYVDTDYLLSISFILWIQINSTCAGILTMSFAVSILITILVLALVCGILYLVWKKRKGREGKKNQSKIRRKAMVTNCTFSSSQLSCGEVDSDLGSLPIKLPLLFIKEKNLLHHVIFSQIFSSNKENCDCWRQCPI